MNEFHDTKRLLNQFRSRIFAASGMVLLCFSLLLARFIWLQTIQYKHYDLAAEDNRITIVPIPPNRGTIVDRNGIVLARNYSAYTLEIDPRKIDRNLELLIDNLATVVYIGTRDRKRFRKQLEEAKNFNTIAIRTLLSDTEVANFAAQRHKFPGVEIQARLFRQYPLGETAAHVIGYIGRISQYDLTKLEAASQINEASGIYSKNFDPRVSITNYQGTNYLGKSGVEESYETALHGVTGFAQVEISAGGRAIRTLATTPAISGNNLVLSIDIKLQYLVEQLFADRRGALVAIEPSTGDILAFVSKPSFNPNLFIDGIDQLTWKALNESLDKPLYNRPLKGIYPPGSTYKPFMALAALTTGERTPDQAISDPGYFMFGNHRFRDDKIGGHGIVDMHKSIVVSCDTYYYTLARDMGVNAIHDFMRPLGFGQVTGIDINGESKGILPSTFWKKKFFRKLEQKKWHPGDTISLGIGQGYNSFTMLQLAHGLANIANNGIVMQPHIVKIIENSATKEKILTTPKESRHVLLKPEHLAIIRNAMVDVNIWGTGARAFRGANYVAASKTGTAQVFNLSGQKYSHSKTSEYLRDHALFISYAPIYENFKPKVALALIVENSGFGAKIAAPIVRQALDFIIEGKWPENISSFKALSTDK